MSNDFPDHDFTIPVRCFRERRPDGYLIVEQMDGTLAKIAPEDPQPTDLSTCTPQYLKDRVLKPEAKRRFPPQTRDFLVRLADDRRMVDFWNWLLAVKFSRVPSLKNAMTVGEAIWRGTRMPGKPGNMTPAQREAYFKKVRHHASALRELLEETRFDRDWKSELSDEELNRSLDESLYDWGGDEPDEGHVVAYLVTTEARYQFHYNFPDNALMGTLFNVIEWTHWDDQWDDNIFSSSAPIVQANAESARGVYFTCTVHDWFAWHGADMPFTILATLANVALDLDADSQMDEEAVRKQVRRYQARKSKLGTEQP